MCQDLWHLARSAAEPWDTMAVVYAGLAATAFLCRHHGVGSRMVAWILPNPSQAGSAQETPHSTLSPLDCSYTLVALRLAGVVISTCLINTLATP